MTDESRQNGTQLRLTGRVRCVSQIALSQPILSPLRNAGQGRFFWGLEVLPARGDFEQLVVHLASNLSEHRSAELCGQSYPDPSKGVGGELRS